MHGTDFCNCCMSVLKLHKKLNQNFRFIVYWYLFFCNKDNLLILTFQFNTITYR